MAFKTKALLLLLSSFSSYYYGDAEFLIEVSGFGEAEYEGAQPILDGLTFAVPASWGEVSDSYYLYFTVYSVKETGAPEIFPSGQVEVILGSLGY